MSVINKYRDPIPFGAINIMRPGPLGNPFIIGRDGNRDAVCDAHMCWAEQRVAQSPEFADMVRNLHKKTLVCCCKPQRCHGDNYIILAARLNSRPSNIAIVPQAAAQFIRAALMEP